MANIITAGGGGGGGGLPASDNIYFVDKSGNGDFTTIQAAINQIFNNGDASATNPYEVIVAPGVYDEQVTIYNEGISVVGAGIGYTIIRPTSGTGYVLNIADQLVKSFHMSGVTIDGTTLMDGVIIGQGLNGATTGQDTILFEQCTILGNTTAVSTNVANTVAFVSGDIRGGTNSLWLYNTDTVFVEGVTMTGNVEAKFDAVGGQPIVSSSKLLLLFSTMLNGYTANIYDDQAIASMGSSMDILNGSTTGVAGCSLTNTSIFGAFTKGTNVWSVFNTHVGTKVLITADDGTLRLCGVDNLGAWTVGAAL